MSRRDRISEIVASVQKIPGTPGDEESLFESGYLDSFALTDLISALESAYGIQVPDSDLNPRKFDNIARIDTYLATRGA